MSFERTCPACGKPLIRKPGEQPAWFARRMTCGNGCANAVRWMTRNQEPVRNCPICGESYGRNKDHKFAVTCGKRKCISLHLIQKHNENSVGWPVLKGEIDFKNAFASQNVNAKDGGFFHPPHVPDTRTLGGVTGGMLVRGGAE